MSQENVEIVRASYEAWNAGDMDAYRELYDPDAVVAPPGGLAGAGAVLRSGGGHALVCALRETWDADTAETISDFIDAARPSRREVDWHGAGQGERAKME